MLIDHRNVFPLNNVLPEGNGYFMDSSGSIFYLRRGCLSNITGVKLPSGLYFTFCGKFFEYNSLFDKARAHPAWATELKLNDTNVLNRSYSVSIEDGIREEGVIIASIESGKLIFGQNPRIHNSTESFRLEMERLARLHPGTKFVALKFIASVIVNSIEWYP